MGPLEPSHSHHVSPSYDRNAGGAVGKPGQPPPIQMPQDQSEMGVHHHGGGGHHKDAATQTIQQSERPHKSWKSNFAHMENAETILARRKVLEDEEKRLEEEKKLKDSIQKKGSDKDKRKKKKKEENQEKEENES